MIPLVEAGSPVTDGSGAIYFPVDPAGGGVYSIAVAGAALQVRARAPEPKKYGRPPRQR